MVVLIYFIYSGLFCWFPFIPSLLSQLIFSCILVFVGVLKHCCIFLAAWNISLSNKYGKNNRTDWKMSFQRFLHNKTLSWIFLAFVPLLLFVLLLITFFNYMSPSPSRYQKMQNESWNIAPEHAARCRLTTQRLCFCVQHFLSFDNLRCAISGCFLGCHLLF